MYIYCRKLHNTQKKQQKQHHQICVQLMKFYKKNIKKQKNPLILMQSPSHKCKQSNSLKANVNVLYDTLSETSLKFVRTNYATQHHHTAIMADPAASPAIEATTSIQRNNSDSHIAHLNAQKNRSNLFLIKSYSFIDKSLKNHVLPQHKSKQTVKKSKSHKFNAQHCDSPSTATEKSQESACKRANNKKTTKVKEKKTKMKTNENDADEAEAEEEQEDLRALLRHPTVIVEGVASEMNARPKSMPNSAQATRTTHKSADTVASPVALSKTKASTQNTFKRESFLRHSLQSIRRSLSAHKKFAGFVHTATNSGTSTTSGCSKASKTTSTCSTTSSTTSNSSTSSKFSNVSSTASVTSPDAVDIQSRTCKQCEKSEKDNIAIMLNGNAVNWQESEDTIGSCVVNEGGKLHAHEKDLCKSVSTFATTTPNDSTSMAPLQTHAETQSVTTLNLHEKETSSPSGSNSLNSSQSRVQQKQQQQQKEQKHKRQSSNQSDNYYTTAYSTTSSDCSTQNLRYSRGEGGSLNPLSPSESSASIRSISPASRKSANNSNWSGHTTAKHEQSTAAATAAAAATTAVPAEKEKKRKEVSSSRVKKFHRHFTQVSKDEKLINYFSCALVSDILLQGHLYITDQHFAFYSNVFGYVTKVVIPTSSVTKISKEKLAKIIPNAVGVATADERHVFGSFMSRESAFRLMCSVCPPLAPIENLPKAPADIEISEEYSIEDDSSCSISGNESPPQALVAAIATTAQSLQRSISIADGTAAASEHQRHSDIPTDAKQAGAFANTNLRASAPPSARYNTNSGGKTANGGEGPTDGIAAPPTGIALIVAGTNTSASSSPTPSTSSSLPTTVLASSTPKSAAHAAMNSFKTLAQKALLRLKFPTELHVVYLGVLLTMVLALFSVFLLYRILDIEAKTSAYRTLNEFNWRTGTDDDIFAEALRWQKELQAKSTEEAQDILTHNLEQIAKVRRSLETLSMLIHDRSSAYENQSDGSD